MKQKKLIFNFFVNRNWKKLTDSRKRAKIIADNRKSHHPIETLLQSNPVNMDTEGAIESVRINGVSVLSRSNLEKV